MGDEKVAGRTSGLDRRGGCGRVAAMETTALVAAPPFGVACTSSHLADQAALVRWNVARFAIADEVVILIEGVAAAVHTDKGCALLPYSHLPILFLRADIAADVAHSDVV